MPLPPTDLFLWLAAKNELDHRRFQQWVFTPAMLFPATKKWWDDSSARGIPHEGLDVAAFLTKDGQTEWLLPQTRIPAAYAGTIARIQPDFLGVSCFLRHDQFQHGNRILYSVYGHLAPLVGLQAGETVVAGEILATLAATGHKKAALRPHLHLTLAWVAATLPAANLGWETMNDPDAVTLLDPLSLVAGAYSVRY